MPKNGSRKLIRIGDRDGWVCGICRDPARPVRRPLGVVTISASDLILEDVPAGTQVDEPQEDVELATRHYDPLAASIDHIWPRSRGGTDDDGNLQITHLRCNLLKHNQAQPPPEYARARLSLTLDGTPVPFGIWRRGSPAPARHARPAGSRTASALDGRARSGGCGTLAADHPVPGLAHAPHVPPAQAGCP